MINGSNFTQKTYVPGEAIVAVKTGAAPSAMQEMLKEYGCTLKDSFELSGKGDASQLLHLKLPESLSTEEAMKMMAQDKEVVFVEPNFVYTLDDEMATKQEQPPAQAGPDSVPNDLSSNLWGLNNTGQRGGKFDADIDAPEAWEIQKGRNDGPIIAIIDTGVDYRHPDLADNMWVNQGEIPGNNIDDDNNGVVDDFYGYNAFDDSGDPMDGNGHGTHCAGTIGAVGNNGRGVVGVNQQARMMAVKIFNDQGRTTSAAILRGIDYAKKMGADITSNSWGGGPFSRAQKEAFEDSTALHIMAAGNSGRDNDAQPNYPSSYEIPNNIAVAASDRNDRKAGFSQYGKTSVDIAAPGAQIYSTLPDNRYGFLSGTSMATPHVSGVAGLVASQYPELDAEGIKEKILLGADKLENWTSLVVDGNRLNAEGALKA